MATNDDDGSTVPRRAGLGAAEEPIMAHRDSTPGGPTRETLPGRDRPTEATELNEENASPARAEIRRVAWLRNISDDTAESIEAVRSAAEDLGVHFFRQTGRREESIRRAATFANNAIEEILLTADDDAAVTALFERIGDPGAGATDAVRPRGGAGEVSGESTVSAAAERLEGGAEGQPSGGGEIPHKDTSGKTGRRGSFTLTPEAEERARTRLDALVRKDAPRPSEEEARNMLLLMAREPELRKKHSGKLSGIYAAVPDDSAFTREDDKRRDVLRESIAKDHALREQSSRWIDLDRHQRETFVRNLVNKTVTAYGMIDNPPRVQFKPLKETGIGAKYDPTTDTIIVNTASPVYRDGTRLGGNIAGTAVHEAIHAYQQRLAKGVADGTIKPDDANYRQGQLFLLNKAEGMALRPNFKTLEGLRAYEAQPVERHARGVVDEFKGLFDFQK